MTLALVAVVAVIWHYWVGVILMLSVPAVFLAVGAGYFFKVVRPKYPPKR